MPANPFFQRIPALIHGISRQSPSIRHAGQVGEAFNVNFDIVDGARKRSGTKHVKSIDGAIYESAYRAHRIERDDDEEYMLIMGPSPYIRVLHISTGIVVTPTLVGNVGAYLSYGSPTASDYRLTTVADTTFIVNTLRPTGVLNDGADLDASKMPVRMTRTSVSPLAFSISVIPWKGRGYHRQILKRVGTVGATGGNFKLSYLGGTTTNILFSANSKLIEDVLQGNGLDPDDYPNDFITGIPAFVRGKVICNGGPLPTKDITIDISPDLDIQALITPTANALTPQPNSYTITRGENTTQPPPLFATDGRKISDIAFFRNRLVLASDDFVFFSAADDIYNLYKERADLLSDSDPVEVQISGGDVTIVDHIVPYRRTVLVTTRAGQQFEVSGGDIFGPGSVAVTPSTRYSTRQIRPVAVGERIYMLGEHPTHSTLLEYYYSDTAVSNVASDVSKHVGNLIPSDVVSMDASPSSDIVCVVGRPDIDDEPRTCTCVYNGFWSVNSSWLNNQPPRAMDIAVIPSGRTIVFDSYPIASVKGNLPASEIHLYRSYTVNNERKQSAWCVWQFATDNIMDAIVMDDELLILRRQDTFPVGGGSPVATLVVERVALTDEETPQEVGGVDFPWQVQLDHAVHLTIGSGTYANGKTTWLIPSDIPATDYALDTVVSSTGTVYNIETIDNTAASIGVVGDLSNTACIIGRKFKASILLSPIYFRTGDNETSVIKGRVGLTQFLVDHANSFQYDIRLLRHSATTLSRFQSTDLNSLGIPTVNENGKHHIWVNNSAEKTTITLESEHPAPVTWSSAEYHGLYSVARSGE